MLPNSIKVSIANNGLSNSASHINGIDVLGFTAMESEVVVIGGNITGGTDLINCKNIIQGANAMITAKFEVGWLEVDCKGETPSEAFLNIGKVQDLRCLANQAQMFGEGEKGEELMTKYVYPAEEGELTFDQLKSIDISFGPGTIRCISATEE